MREVRARALNLLAALALRERRRGIVAGVIDVPCRELLERGAKLRSLDQVDRSRFG